MRKKNGITFLFFLFLIGMTVVYMMIIKKEVPVQPDLPDKVLAKEDKEGLKENSFEGNLYKEETSDEIAEVPEETPENNLPGESEEIKTDGTVTMADALFIGDSRTVGLMEYAGIEGADFFCSSGMSVFNIYAKPLSVPNVGKLTLEELLNNKKYGKIYIMLGVNELGYPFESIVGKYQGLLEYIENKQPEAFVFIQANLHVSKKRSDGDKYINNAAINRLNGELAALADNTNEFYLDANVLFDDGEGNLSTEKSRDNAHPYGKYYEEWGLWITNKTASLIGEEQR